MGEPEAAASDDGGCFFGVVCASCWRLFTAALADGVACGLSTPGGLLFAGSVLAGKAALGDGSCFFGMVSASCWGLSTVALEGGVACTLSTPGGLLFTDSVLAGKAATMLPWSSSSIIIVVRCSALFGGAAT